MRIAAIAVTLAVAITAGCSSDAKPTRSADATTSPTGTVMFVEFTTTWAPSNDLGEDEDLVLAELRGSDVFAIVPPASLQAQDYSGELRIRQSGPTADVYVDMVVRAADGEVVLSTTGTSSVHPSCQDRLDGVGGEEGWRLVEVRTTPGCAATNAAGLTFIEWTEADLWWHAETRMEPTTAVAWLADWTVLR